MSNRKLCGYDVNGWRDGVVRNWVAHPGEEQDIGRRQIVAGAVLPDVVRVDGPTGARWIGGAQADLAPHGRGGGWGQIGAPDRRRAVRSLLTDETAPSNALAAAFTGLARGASHSVAAIDDTDRVTEAMQERLVAALSAARAGKALLVWRSVLAVLQAQHAGQLKGAARDGALIGIISHVAEGFSVQTLRMRAQNRGGELHLAPERRQVGRLVRSPLGYDGLMQAAFDQIMALAPQGPSDHFRGARAIGRLAFGLGAEPEPLRRANGDWDILIPPPDLVIPRSAPGPAWNDSLQGCDIILFESLTEAAPRDAVVRALQDDLPMPLVALPAATVARGALIAAERHAAGQTVYFDFLPRIATIVQGEDGVTSHELIDATETLPAGQLYRSPRPALFGLSARQSRIQVYLRKETHAAPRRATIDLDTPPRQFAPVNLWVEQVPAAGRARILMQAPTLSRQFAVDWDAAEVLNQSWEEILAELATPPPTIPNPLSLPCSMRKWHDSPRSDGLLTLLAANVRKRRPDWDALAKKLGSPTDGTYCISSDGALPADVPAEAIEQLSELSARAVTELHRMVRGALPPDTAPLRFLTWQFRRCPDPVPGLLLDAWEALDQGAAHPLATSRVLTRQGLGRILSDPGQERQALDLLLRKPVSSWVPSAETAAAAFLLSRSETSPALLERHEVERLAKRVLHEFDANIGTGYTTFQYALFLLVGLLRWRLKSPRALVEGSDPLADRLVDAVRRVSDDMHRRAERELQIKRVAARWLQLLSDTLDELRGRGGNRDLLSAIFQATTASADSDGPRASG